MKERHRLLRCGYQSIFKIRNKSLFFVAFLFCQCCFNAFVTLASQVRSCICSSGFDPAKYLTLLGGGLSNGFSIRAASCIETSAKSPVTSNKVAMTKTRQRAASDSG